ncbi:nucleotidyltransferase domain-containing protein [Candidatus Pacearchaeota archaeon]|nr:nucleotidyltransferase domain-containing protein [Candidatus Pacearchaeota archaeon]
MGLLRFLKTHENARKIFGKRELKIIEKQLWGMRLSQSEKNRLSRDIRKKLNFIKDVSQFHKEFSLKYAVEINDLVNEAKEVILEHKWFRKIKKIYLFGSVINKEHNLSSDIDIAVIFDTINQEEAIIFRKEIMGKLPPKIDIQVYNVLPLKVRKSIDAEKRVIYER